MGRSGASSSPCGPAVHQQVYYGPRGMSLEVLGSRCSAKTLKNKIEFYNTIKLDLKLHKIRLSRRFDDTRVLIRIKFLFTREKALEYVDMIPEIIS